MRAFDRSPTAARVLAASVLGFFAVALAATSWDAGDRLDVRFAAWARGASPELLVELMRALTYAGSIVVLGPLALGAALLLLHGRRPRAAAYVLASFVVGQLLTQALKAAFQRPRPELLDGVVQLSTYAFPSGHALGATTTYGAIAVVLATVAVLRRGLLAVLLASLVVAVAASRVVLGAHYALDVLGGILAGSAVLAGLLLALDAARGATPARARAPAARAGAGRPAPPTSGPAR